MRIVAVEGRQTGVIDPSNLSDLLITCVDGHANEKYLDDLSNRTLGGQIQNIKHGFLAGQEAPYGYDRMYVDQDGNPKVRVRNGEGYAKHKSWRSILVPSDDPEIVERVRWIFRTYVTTNLGMRGIADELNRQGIPSPRGNTWHQGTIRAILNRRTYTGDLIWNVKREGKHYHCSNGKATPRPRAEVREDTPQVLTNDPTDWLVIEQSHEPLIAKELYEQAQARMSQKRHEKSPKSRVAQAYLLSGLVRCGHCGAKMHGQCQTRRKNGKVYRWRRYICSTYVCKGASQCNHNFVRADDVERTIVDILAQLFRPRTSASESGRN